MKDMIVINAQAPALRIETRNTKGSGENVPLLGAGKLDIALVAGEVANAALAKPDTDGRAAAMWGAGVGWPAFTALAKAGGRFIGPDENEIKTILARNPALQRVTLPAKSYPGQDARRRAAARAHPPRRAAVSG